MLVHAVPTLPGGCLAGIVGSAGLRFLAFLWGTATGCSRMAPVPTMRLGAAWLHRRAAPALLNARLPDGRPSSAGKPLDLDKEDLRKRQEAQ